MCGIVGAIAQRKVITILLEGLKRLEYRGYDSAGVAVIDKNNDIACSKSIGKVQQLVDTLKEHPLDGCIGIAHTRWATHGKPTTNNAHPHLSNDIAIVHNGIIENYAVIKEALLSNGYTFVSETDTEVLAHLISENKKHTSSLLEAIQKTVKEVIGSYGTVVLDKTEPEHLIAARSGSPIVIGVGIGENFVASDTFALLPVTNRFIYLEEGDIADIYKNEIKIYDRDGNLVNRDIVESDLINDDNDKGQYHHFMEKEILEQTIAIERTLESKFVENKFIPEVFGANAKSILKQVKNIHIVACGTSFHAGLVAKHWFEEYLGVSTQVEIASEYRYRKSFVPENTLFVTLSQSGETADTLAALRLAKNKGYLTTLAICNVPDSSLVRESELVFLTRAGKEIGVASTKAFTTQLIALLLLMGAIGESKNIWNTTEEQNLVTNIKSVTDVLTKTLTLNKAIKDISKSFVNKKNCIFLGRGNLFPIALEGALKLKEISYIHAEGYAAGELKHGPLALIDSDMPIVVIAPNNALFDKLRSNIQEVAARGGIIYVFKGQDTDIKSSTNMTCIDVPKVDDLIAPIIYTIPLQLLSYYVALAVGNDVDQPRNLAKSVTVE